jgi:hypothetical protein
MARAGAASKARRHRSAGAVRRRIVLLAASTSAIAQRAPQIRRTDEEAEV